jgi:hypothetical protein
VRSATALAAAAPVDPNVQSAKKRRRDGTGVEESADEGYYGDMVPFYRAVLYPQDGNQDAGGLTFSLAHMADPCDEDGVQQFPSLPQELPNTQHTFSNFLRKEFPKSTKLRTLSL